MEDLFGRISLLLDNFLSFYSLFRLNNVLRKPLSLPSCLKDVLQQFSLHIRDLLFDLHKELKFLRLLISRIDLSID